MRISNLILYKAVLIALLIPSSIHAQESTEFFNLSYSNIGKYGNSNTNKVAVDMMDMNLITPTINIGKKTKINNMLNYRLLDYSPDSRTEKKIEDLGNLSDIQYALLVRHQISERWNIIALPQIILRSNFRSNFGSRDFFPALAILAMNKSRNNERLTWGYGGSYSRDFTKNTFTPLFSVSYSSPKFRLEALLPVKAQIVISPSNFWEYGIDANLETAIYNVGSKNDLETQYLKTISLPVTMTAALKIHGMFWVKAKVGMMFLRNYDLLDRSYDPIFGKENQIESSPYFSIGLSLRLKE